MLENLPRFVFINEKCESLKVVNDGGKLTKNINQRRCQTFYKNSYESISSITTYNIVNQLGKHDFFCGSVVNNLKDRKLFFDQLNRNRFDPISARRDWNCSTL